MFITCSKMFGKINFRFISKIFGGTVLLATLLTILGSLLFKGQLAKYRKLSRYSSYTEKAKENIAEFKEEYTLNIEDTHEIIPGSTIKRPSTPVHHVAFIKIHKCASSTAQNVFLRFGHSRNLTFLMSRIRPDMPYSNVISFANTLNDHNVQPAPANKTFDIVSFHVVYNKAAFAKYMPADTQYIGIIRDPYEHFMSILRYFRPVRVLFATGPNNQRDDPIGYFLTNTTAKRGGFLLDNPACTEYGIHPSLKKNYNETAMKLFLQSLENDFILIIVSEYFEESMVLLRRYLNWNTKDILFSDLNVSGKKSLQNVKTTSRHRDLVYKKFHLDVILYKYFFERLWRQIQSEGMDFFRELLEYRRIRRKVNMFCSKKEYQTDNAIVIEDSQWSKGFRFTFKDCKLLTMHEMAFTKMLRKKQFGEDDDPR